MESDNRPGQLKFTRIDLTTSIEKRINLDLNRVFWHRWSGESTDVLIVAGEKAGGSRIYRVDAESGQVTLSVGVAEKAVYGFATPLNNYGFTIDRFRNDSNSLSDLDRNGNLVPVQDGMNGMPAFLGQDNGFLFFQFRRDGHTISFGEPKQEIFISGQDQRQGTSLVSVTASGTAFLLSSVGADTLGLLELNLKGGEQKVIARYASDIHRVILNPLDFKPDAVETELTAPELHILEDRIRPDFERLLNAGWGFPRIVDRSPNDKFWIVKFGARENAPIWAVYDRSSGNVRSVQLTSQVGATAANWQVIEFSVMRANEPELRGYITMPSNNLCHNKPCPLLLKLHGGPALRDFADVDLERYWLVSRGIAVATINFRGSRGFGKEFEALDRKQWFSGIVLDAHQGLDHILKTFRIDRERIAVMGSSFGGKLALDLAVRNKAIKCGVIDSTATDELQFVESSIKKNGDRSDLIGRVGDSRLEDDRNMLARVSSVNQIQQLKNLNLLQFHGGVDSIIAPDNNQHFVEKMLEKNPHFTYVFMQKEGHGLLGARQHYAAITEQFLGKCFQIAVEPLTESEISFLMNSTIVQGDKTIFSGM